MKRNLISFLSAFLMLAMIIVGLPSLVYARDFIIRNATTSAVHFKIDGATGNISIATGTTAGEKLEVVGNIKISGTGSVLKFPDGTIQSTGGSGLITAANVTGAWFGANTGSPGFYAFGTSSNPILYVDNTNTRVGIGNASPAGLLHVSSSALYVSSTTGNVGIGTTSPGYKLDVVGRSRFKAGPDFSAGFWLRNVADTADSSFIGRLDDVSAGTGIWDGTKWALIVKDTTGNVGIGTAGPASLFSVGASSQFQVDTTGKVVAGIVPLGRTGVVGTFVFSAVASNTTVTQDIAHGLGTDNVMVFLMFKITDTGGGGSAGTNAYVRAIRTDGHIFHNTMGNAGVSGPTIPPAGSIRLQARQEVGITQNISVRYVIMREN